MCVQCVCHGKAINENASQEVNLITSFIQMPHEDSVSRVFFCIGEDSESVRESNGDR